MLSAKKGRKSALPSYGWGDYEAVKSDSELNDRDHRAGYNYPDRQAVSNPYMGRFPPENYRNYDRILDTVDENQTDEEEKSSYTLDEFGDSINLANKIVRTGRQRKKLAARSKGGEFRAKRKKRRVYFCCVSSDIDVQKLFDYLVGAGSLLNGWKYELYADVLRLFKPGADEVGLPSSSPIPVPAGRGEEIESIDRAITPPIHISFPTNMYALRNPASLPSTNSGRSGVSSLNSGTGRADLEGVELQAIPSLDESRDYVGSLGSASSLPDRDMNSGIGHMVNGTDGAGSNGINQSLVDRGRTQSMGQLPVKDMKDPPISHSSKLSGVGAQEVFVFDFGAAVFWGFSRGEETNLLKTIRMFVVKGLVGASEFQSGEDDMAFVTTPDADAITIANDVITLPEDTPAKQRLSVSFAIAQSTVLAIFEARIDRKIEEYKYIPEALAAYGRVQLTERQLGIMIGELA
jgi:uncharacterized Rmd1/YagE family protein